MSSEELEMRSILILSGSPKEVIDGVRYYASVNGVQGFLTAKTLALKGNQVTVIMPDDESYEDCENLRIITKKSDGTVIVSAEDMVKAASEVCAENKFDLAIQLANTASFKAHKPVSQKLKVKDNDLVSFEIEKNTDLFLHLQSLGLPVIEEPDELNEKPVLKSPAREPKTKELIGIKVIVSSGAVSEILTAKNDVITNFSSGKQGFEIAYALADRGADVLLIAGNVHLPEPSHTHIKTIYVQSTEEMLKACQKGLPAHAYIGVAAVADFGIKTVINNIEEYFASDRVRTIEMKQNPDILSYFGHLKETRPEIVIGFAAETHDLLSYAEQKLHKKNADVIFANSVSKDNNAMGSDNNRVYMITKNKTVDCGYSSKYRVGEIIAEIISSNPKLFPALQK